MNELLDAHHYIAHKVTVVHTNSSVAANTEHIFRIRLNKKLSEFGIVVEKFVLPDDPQTIYDMFRELLGVYGLKRNDYIDKIVDGVAELVIKCNIFNYDMRIFAYEYDIYNDGGYYGTIYFVFKYDVKSKILFYIRSRFEYPVYDKERMLIDLARNNPVPLTVGFRNASKNGMPDCCKSSEQIKELVSLYLNATIGLVCNIFFGIKASQGAARVMSGFFFKYLRCSPAQKPPSVVRIKSGVMPFFTSTLKAEERQIINILSWLVLIVFIHGLSCGPEAHITTGNCVLISGSIKFLA